MIDQAPSGMRSLASSSRSIAARSSLDDVSTDVRRVGLDRDPGYVPWLGVVVKFVYD